MRLLTPDIPPHVADVIRRLPPDVKHSVKQAIRALAQNPQLIPFPDQIRLPQRPFINFREIQIPSQALRPHPPRETGEQILSVVVGAKDPSPLDAPRDDVGQHAGAIQARCSGPSASR